MSDVDVDVEDSSAVIGGLVDHAGRCGLLPFVREWEAVAKVYLYVNKGLWEQDADPAHLRAWVLKFPC